MKFQNAFKITCECCTLTITDGAENKYKFNVATLIAERCNNLGVVCCDSTAKDDSVLIIGIDTAHPDRNYKYHDIKMKPSEYGYTDVAALLEGIKDCSGVDLSGCLPK